MLDKLSDKLLLLIIELLDTAVDVAAVKSTCSKLRHVIEQNPFRVAQKVHLQLVLLPDSKEEISQSSKWNLVKLRFLQRRHWQKPKAANRISPSATISFDDALRYNFVADKIQCRNIVFTKQSFAAFVDFVVNCNQQFLNNPKVSRSSDEMQLSFYGCKAHEMVQGDLQSMLKRLATTKVALSFISCELDYHAIFCDQFFVSVSNIAELEIDARSLRPLGEEIDMTEMTDATIEHWLQCPPTRLQLWNVQTQLTADGFKRLYECSVAAELRCAQLRPRKMSQTYVRFTENDEFGTVARRWWNYENFDEQTERLNLYDFRNYAFDLVS